MDCEKSEPSSKVEKPKSVDKIPDEQPPSNVSVSCFIQKRNLSKDLNESVDNQTSVSAESISIANPNDEQKSYHKSDAIELAIERINALQNELKMHNFDDDSDSELENEDYIEEEEEDLGLANVDAKTLGFIACAQETIQYLTSQGISRDNPMMVNLKNRLIEEINRI